MTLIVTQISKLGIIQACDTNITYRNPNTGKVTKVEEHDKVFPIPHLNAALTVAGSFSVNNVLMDAWMPTFIQKQSNQNAHSLEEFANNLRDSLQSEMTNVEKGSPCFAHIAGYSKTDTLPHPEFWFVRNAWGINQEHGGYEDIRQEFQVSEDFWKRDYPNNYRQNPLEWKGYQIYANGFPAGRTIYWNILVTHNNLLNMIWNNPAWNFRPPQTLEEMKSFLELDLHYISEIFKISHYDAPYIGGTPKTHLIPNPLLL